ncbi:MAG: hypothetical protein NUW00_02235 [Candidatus Kaiserbacteria bacterium]|nr:hypothetical protein [Candidatus Kaiserbacteria bacterium]
MSDADNTRGIQNAEARYPTAEDRQTTRSNERLTSAQLRRPRGRRVRSGDTEEAVSPYFDDPNDLSPSTIKEFGDIFEKGGVRLDDSELREALEMKLKDVTAPGFPYFIFFIALTKDIVDVVVTVTVIGIVISMALSFLCALILFIWTMEKLGVSGGKLQKKRVQGILIKYGLSTGIEFIPGINVIPTTTIFVLLTYLQEAKISRLHKFALNKIQRRLVR